MRGIKAAKIFLWLVCCLILFLCFYVYSGFKGTPWEKKQQETNMQSYLEKKYKKNFVMMKTTYNYLSETYQSYAYPKNHQELLFLVLQDPDSKIGYSDTYPKVIWGSDFSSNMKEKIKKLFPRLDESTLKVLQIDERGEYFGPHIPTYEGIHASTLSCSLSINIQMNGEQMNQKMELAKMTQISNYLKTVHFPVLVEVRYFEKEMHDNEKVFFITEDGKIVYN